MRVCEQCGSEIHGWETARGTLIWIHADVKRDQDHQPTPAPELPLDVQP